MKLSDFYNEGKYLNAADVPAGKQSTVTIERIEVETIRTNGNRREVLVVYFRGAAKGLVLNATNGKLLADAFGDDADACIGQDIVLFRDTTDFKGESVPCLRIRVSIDEAATEDDRLSPRATHRRRSGRQE